jgi:hypothetical protein
MSRVVVRGGVRLVLIEPEPDDVCELCGAVEETRPYGPGGKRICYGCGMKHQAGTERRMGVQLFGEGHD